MTQEFLWYVLAGFLIGFGVSTLWEWLFFRQKRMRIENRRIAELEATLRSYTQATDANATAEGDLRWRVTDYESPGVLLENEETNGPPPTLPVAPEPTPVGAAVAGIATVSANGVHQRKNGEKPHPPQEEPDRMPVAAVAAGAALTGAAAASRKPEELPLENPAAAPLDSRQKPESEQTISPEQLDELVDSIHRLIDNMEVTGAATAMDKDVQEVARAMAAVAPATQAAQADSFAANNLTRSEYAFVRLSQTLRQLFRELLSIFRRKPARRISTPALSSRMVQQGDDLTLIAGMSMADVDRLRVAGITSYEQLARLSTSELEQLFASPNNEPLPDFTAWLESAQALTTRLG